MLLGAAPVIQALDLTPLVGTTEVQFHPVQSGGLVEGCTLIYHVIGQDYVYQEGNLIGLVGTIAYYTNNDRNTIGLSLKIGVLDSLESHARMEAPFFAYLQSPHGTTLTSKFAKADPEMPGSRLFAFEFDENALQVFKDLMDGLPITIGFNRHKGGLHILVPLDLGIAESIVGADGSVARRRSGDMLNQFITCTTEVTEQVQRKRKAR